MTQRRKTLRRELFKRDGWLITDPYAKEDLWVVWCAFGCGTLLTQYNATIDHYPVPRRLGGHAVLDNTRLACVPCNTADGGAAGAGGKFVPRGLTPAERRVWWQENQEWVQGLMPARDDRDARRGAHRRPA